MHFPGSGAVSILLGCVADDFTGATDLANTLVKAHMRTVQLLGVPRPGLKVPAADCIIVALKSRSNPADEAVTMSLAALDWLRQQGAKQFYFKYCSTFDSTDKGNIGPVADAMLDAIGAEFTVFNPAFPTNKRTVYKGYLFVGDELLSESGMRHHPLTPMTDPSLVRVLQRQTRHKVGLVPYATIVNGVEAIRDAFEKLRKQGIRHAILDSITDEHLVTLGEACADLKVVTGGSGMAMGLPAIVTPPSRGPVSTGVEGIVVPSRSVEGIAHALDRLIGSAELRRAMGDAARRGVAEKHGWQDYADRAIAAYRAVLA